MLRLLANIATAIGSLFGYKSSAVSQRRAAEDDLKKRQDERDELRREIKRAVFAQDDNALNEILSRILIVLIVCAVAIGCSIARPEIVYIPTDRRVESCTNSIGIACKAVPDAVFVELLVKVQELEELKKERDVERRLK